MEALYNCQQGDCLRNAFLLMYNEAKPEDLPHRAEGYSISEIDEAMRIAGHSGKAFEYLFSDPLGAVDDGALQVLLGMQRVAKVGMVPMLCYGFNEKNEPHGWGLVYETTGKQWALFDAAKGGMEVLTTKQFLEIAARTRQIALWGRRGFIEL